MWWLFFDFRRKLGSRYVSFLITDMDLVLIIDMDLFLIIIALIL
jgi:hypothetical protein